MYQCSNVPCIMFNVQCSHSHSLVFLVFLEFLFLFIVGEMCAEYENMKTNVDLDGTVRADKYKEPENE